MDLAAKDGSSSAVSELQKRLRDGSFVVTAELSPPVSTDPTEFIERALALRGLATAINVTDGAGSKAHMSSLAAAHFLVRNGVEPILQMTCRDRNRIALQAELLGAAALGIHNILALRGAAARSGRGAKIADPDRHRPHPLAAFGALDEGEALRGDHSRSDSGTSRARRRPESRGQENLRRAVAAPRCDPWDSRSSCDGPRLSLGDRAGHPGLRRDRRKACQGCARLRKSNRPVPESGGAQRCVSGRGSRALLPRWNYPA